jgi:hypothetical protein
MTPATIVRRTVTAAARSHRLLPRWERLLWLQRVGWGRCSSWNGLTWPPRLAPIRGRLMATAAVPAGASAIPEILRCPSTRQGALANPDGRTPSEQNAARDNTLDWLCEWIDVPPAPQDECVRSPIVQRCPVNLASLWELGRMQHNDVTLTWRSIISDDELADLTAAHGGSPEPGWWVRVSPHSLDWVAGRAPDGQHPARERTGHALVGGRPERSH